MESAEGAPLQPPGPGAPPQPGSITRDLTMRLVGATPAAASGDDRPMRNRSDGFDQDDPTVLQRQSTTQLNRERFQEHQRVIAGETLLNTTMLMGCLGLIFFAIVVAAVMIYMTGWTVWAKHRDEPCDQPLQWWLFTMLLIPVIQCQLNHHVDERYKRLQVFIMPILLSSGIYMLVKCKTCSETNPSLFQFVKMYLIFQSVLWMAMMCMFFCFVTVIMWAHQRGLLPTPNGGPSNPAKPGTIDKIETVPFSPELFSEAVAEGESPECSICQDVFNSEKPIKRTPCGHFFHEECIFSWLEKFAKSCPLCRANIEEAIEAKEAPLPPAAEP